jgi:uncharacterized protein (TIGR03067 family)
MLSDLEKLQGTWNVTSLESDGQAMPEGSFDGYEGALELDQKKNPKTFRILFTVGHAAGTCHRGIYKIEGAKWTMCLATRGRLRPPRFATKANSGFVLQTLERDGIVRKQKRPRSHEDYEARLVGATVGPAITSSNAQTTWEGEWQMVAGVFNGAPMAENMVQWCKRVTRGNVTSVVAGPKVMLKATFSLDDSKTPQAVDYVNLEGTNARKAQAGIFEISDSQLKVCMSAPGKPRPADFSSKPRDGRSFTTWRLLRK